MWIDDQLLNRSNEPLALSIWVPQTPIVVLGSSNKAEQEANVSACESSGIPILKRYGGGGTVLLHSGCVVVSIGAWVKQVYQNKIYFDLFNRAVITALNRQWPIFAELGQRGLSDISYGERKVAGTSLFRSRNYALYQASILVDLQLPMIEKYLRHPTREPDYRQGRPHGDFLIGLAQILPGEELPAAAVAVCLEKHLPAVLAELGAEEFIDPQVTQIPHLEQRAAGAFS